MVSIEVNRSGLGLFYDGGLIQSGQPSGFSVSLLRTIAENATVLNRPEINE